MIVSYKHQFIFVHLGRTGGRSLTESLIPHCGSDDIITPIGDLPGQNHRGWHRHESALSIRDRLGREFFDQCYVFTVEMLAGVYTPFCKEDEFEMAVCLRSGTRSIGV